MNHPNSSFLMQIDNYFFLKPKLQKSIKFLSAGTSSPKQLPGKITKQVL